MAGHSKWANIKHRKGAQDAKRGKVFTKLIREITVSAKQGGADIAANFRLRSAVAAARSQNLPSDTIERAIKRGSGGLEQINYEEMRYEGYGPGGVAVIVDCLSDNRIRTVSEVRYIFGKNGGNMGADGCVSYLFDRKGQLVFENVSEDLLMEAAIEAGAEDVVNVGDNTFEVLTQPADFETVREALANAGFDKPVSAAVAMLPQTTVTLNEAQATTMLRLVDMLEDNDDVQHVYANFDIPDEIMERLGG